MAAEILQGLRVNRWYFWSAICGMLLGYTAITVYVNSRTANPYAPIEFEDQNKLSVVYEKSSAIGSLKRIMSYRFKHAETSEQRAQALRDYEALKQALAEQ